MSPYIFVIAAVLAVIPILFVYKITMERIKENPGVVAKAQTHFFIGVALSEVIPIILIVFGMANLVPVNNTEELFLPAIIIFLLIGFSTLFIFLQRAFDVEKEAKEAVHTFAMISFAISNAIPIVALVSLFMMMPQ